MIDYFSSFTNTNGLSFPDTLGVNASGPSATDGTEWVKLFIDDVWGARQALLDHVSLVPDGVTEGPGASQVLEAMNLMCLAPGIGGEWDRADDPSDEGFRMLYKHGQGVLVANYPDLDTACYVGDANNAAVAAAGGAYFRADNSDGTSPNTAGVYLILPESRGVAVRGLDPSATIDPDGASRYLGDHQGDAFQGHWHDLYYNNAQLYQGGAVSSTTNPTVAVNTLSAVNNVQSPKSDGVNGTPRTSSETRMYNRSTKFVVGY